MNGCAKHGGMHRGEFPEGVNAYIQYGQNLSSLLVNLSKNGMDENSVLPDFKGIAVHDCWKAYWRYLEATHAICTVHILRELVGVIENPPPLQTEIKRGRKKKGKVLALIERLAQLKDSMLLFARNFEVSFTNNAAERTIRNLKSKKPKIIIVHKFIYILFYEQLYFLFVTAKKVIEELRNSLVNY